MALTYPLITISSRLQVQKDKKGKDAYKVATVCGKADRGNGRIVGCHRFKVTAPQEFSFPIYGQDERSLDADPLYSLFHESTIRAVLMLSARSLPRRVLLDSTRKYFLPCGSRKEKKNKVSTE